MTMSTCPGLCGGGGGREKGESQGQKAKGLQKFRLWLFEKGIEEEGWYHNPGPRRDIKNDWSALGPLT